MGIDLHTDTHTQLCRCAYFKYILLFHILHFLTRINNKKQHSSNKSASECKKNVQAATL